MRLLARRSGSAARFAQTPVPDPRLPWREAEWCAIDLELTGLHRGDEIIAIGAVPIRDGALILGEAMYTLARPGRPPRYDAVLVHKLRSADLEQAPTPAEAIDRLLDVLAGRVPVFHTAIVERTFLGRELRSRRLHLPRDADTEVLGRLWLRTRDGVNRPGLPLARLATVLGQPAEDPHHALGDALTTGKAFIALATHLERAGYRTVGSLTHAEPRSGRATGRFRPD
ncbi:MAG TPA: 3'-5' exonuclease [Solirubrobacteraceae bacterium]|nr:3'-5' exonuclease [Solirubrobacteraceae bacterium]